MCKECSDIEQRLLEEANHVVFTIEVDLDPIPGANHYGEDCIEWVMKTLNQMIPHYNPTLVKVVENSRPIPEQVKEFRRLEAEE